MRSTPERPQPRFSSNVAGCGRHARRTPGAELVAEPGPFEELGRHEQDRLAEPRQHGPPLPVRKLAVDSVEDMEIGFEGPGGEQVVAPHLGFGKEIVQTRESPGSEVGADELDVGSLPSEVELDERSADAVRADAARAELVGDRRDRGGTLREVKLAGRSLPVGARRRQAKRARRLANRIPRLWVVELRADDVAIRAEVVVVLDRDRNPSDRVRDHQDAGRPGSKADTGGRRNATRVEFLIGLEFTSRTISASGSWEEEANESLGCDPVIRSGLSHVAHRVPLRFKRRLHVTVLVMSRKRAYSVSAWSGAGIRHLFLDREMGNFTYDIANTDELPRFVAASTGHPLDPVEGYLQEIVTDDALHRELTELMQQRKDRNAIPRFGRRLGWYCIARACRPGLIIETGTHDGLGTALLLRAAERNAAEGTPTRVVTLDIDPASGWLIPEHLKARLDVGTGDTRETLPRAVDGQEVGMLIHDSEHTAERERFEFGIAIEHAASSLVLISDNAHATTALRDLAEELGIEYHHFVERPVRHFYPGAAIGLAIYRRG